MSFRFVSAASSQRGGGGAGDRLLGEGPLDPGEAGGARRRSARARGRSRRAGPFGGARPAPGAPERRADRCATIVCITRAAGSQTPELDPKRRPGRVARVRSAADVRRTRAGCRAERRARTAGGAVHVWLEPTTRQGTTERRSTVHRVPSRAERVPAGLIPVLVLPLAAVLLGACGAAASPAATPAPTARRRRRPRRRATPAPATPAPPTAPATTPPAPTPSPPPRGRPDPAGDERGRLHRAQRQPRCRAGRLRLRGRPRHHSRRPSPGPRTLPFPARRSGRWGRRRSPPSDPRSTRPASIDRRTRGRARSGSRATPGRTCSW